MTDNTEARRLLAELRYLQRYGAANGRERLAYEQAGDFIEAALRQPRPDAAAVERVNAADAFNMGYVWAKMLTGQNIEDGRAVGRTLLSDIFAPIAARIDAELKNKGFNSFEKAEAGICSAKRIIFAALTATPEQPPTFQDRVQPWMMECFGPEISGDREERNHRFLEEALELVQSTGCTASEAHQLVDYVYGRATGEPGQEVGGVMVTLAALCLANGLNMHEAGETELARISRPATVAKIRAKQAAKPKHSPLPEQPPADMVMVPREPTEAMILAAAATPGMQAANDTMTLHQARGYSLDPEAFKDGSPLHQAWRAMLSEALK